MCLQHLYLTTWPISVCTLQRSIVVLGCDHRTTINCSSHANVHLPSVCAPSTPPDQHPETLYLLQFVIRQSHWEPLGRCWNRFCSDWQICIAHGIHVAARAFVTFVKGRSKCLLLLLLLCCLIIQKLQLRQCWSCTSKNLSLSCLLAAVTNSLCI